MKIPGTLRIMGHDVEITKLTNHQSCDDGNMGFCRLKKGQIGIQDDDMVQSQKEATLIHEILEWFNNDMGLGMEHDKLSILACCLYQVLHDNKMRFDE